MGETLGLGVFKYILPGNQIDRKSSDVLLDTFKCTRYLPLSVTAQVLSLSWSQMKVKTNSAWLLQLCLLAAGCWYRHRSGLTKFLSINFSFFNFYIISNSIVCDDVRCSRTCCGQTHPTSTLIIIVSLSRHRDLWCHNIKIGQCARYYTLSGAKSLSPLQGFPLF